MHVYKYMSIYIISINLNCFPISIIPSFDLLLFIMIYEIDNKLIVGCARFGTNKICVVQLVCQAGNLVMLGWTVTYLSWTSFPKFALPSWYESSWSSKRDNPAELP